MKNILKTLGLIVFLFYESLLANPKQQMNLDMILRMLDILSQHYHFTEIDTYIFLETANNLRYNKYKTFFEDFESKVKIIKNFSDWGIIQNMINEKAISIYPTNWRKIQQEILNSQGFLEKDKNIINDIMNGVYKEKYESYLSKEDYISFALLFKNIHNRFVLKTIQKILNLQFLYLSTQEAIATENIYNEFFSNAKGTPLEFQFIRTDLDKNKDLLLSNTSPTMVNQNIINMECQIFGKWCFMLSDADFFMEKVRNKFIEKMLELVFSKYCSEIMDAHTFLETTYALGYNKHKTYFEVIKSKVKMIKKLSDLEIVQNLFNEQAKHITNWINTQKETPKPQGTLKKHKKDESSLSSEDLDNLYILFRNIYSEDILSEIQNILNSQYLYLSAQKEGLNENIYKFDLNDTETTSESQSNASINSVKMEDSKQNLIKEVLTYIFEKYCFTPSDANNFASIAKRLHFNKMKVYFRTIDQIFNYIESFADWKTVQSFLNNQAEHIYAPTDWKRVQENILAYQGLIFDLENTNDKPLLSEKVLTTIIKLFERTQNKFDLKHIQKMLNLQFVNIYNKKQEQKKLMRNNSPKTI